MKNFKKLPTEEQYAKVEGTFDDEDIPKALKDGTLSTGSGYCATRVSQALNRIPGHEIPGTKKYESNLYEGSRYIISAQKMHNYFKAVYGPGILLTDENISKIAAENASRTYVYFVPDTKVAEWTGHTAFGRFTADGRLGLSGGGIGDSIYILPRK